MRAGLWISLVFVLFLKGIAHSQNNTSDYIRDIVLKVDTSQYSLKENIIMHNDEEHLYFNYDQEDEVCEVKIYPGDSLAKLSLLPSKDFIVVDSLINMNGEYYKFKVRFQALTTTRFLNFTFAFRSKNDTIDYMQEVKLLPYTYTTIDFQPVNEELFIGEEKVFDLVSNNVNNIRLVNEWKTYNNIDYRITKKQGELRLHILPHELGNKNFSIQLSTIKPFINENEELIYDMPGINYQFYIKSSRLVFLNIDKKEVTLDDKAREEGIEIQLDDHRNLELQKTYRVENQEQKGGTLIAEVFTRNKLATNKVLCQLRLYNYHRKSDGYLYIKDGDEPKFITNLSITPRTTIEKISVLHEGEDWTNNLNIYPGETIDVKIEGKALHKANFVFEDLLNLTPDSSIRSENTALYKLEVPLTIMKRKVNIYNHNESTGFSLTVKEYQKPRQFDYIQINYGDIDRTLSLLKSPVLWDKTIKDLTFEFIPRRIDDGKILYGKQYLNIDVKITGPRNQLMEVKSIENVVVCPGKNSPRFAYYNDKNCQLEPLSLNQHLSTKTYDLDDWSKIELTVKNDDDKYEEEGYSKKMDIYLSKRYTFDIDVSFPAGLLTIGKEERVPIAENSNDTITIGGFGNLSGISMAMIAQFSFYYPDRIAKLKPYKIGAGFLALNAFNFNSQNQDLGIVVLGSLYPTSKNSKLSFPLYVGGGYFLKYSKWFFLIGPGIRVRL